MKKDEALNCSEFPNNSDTISRQQAIDAVAKWIFEVFGIKESDGTATVFKRLRELPSAQPYTTTHDSIPAETGENDGDRTSGDCISRQMAIDALLGITAMRNTIPLDSAIFNIKKLPSVQPERKDAVEKAVAVEAISDELMSRFDISTTYAYEVAESAVNRIEVMAKELKRGEQEWHTHST